MTCIDECDIYEYIKFQKDVFSWNLLINTDRSEMRQTQTNIYILTMTVVHTAHSCECTQSLYWFPFHYEHYARIENILLYTMHFDFQMMIYHQLWPCRNLHASMFSELDMLSFDFVCSILVTSNP